MNCQNHPNNISVATCQFCGKNLCEDCKITIAGRNYCENCMDEILSPELANRNKNTVNSANTAKAIDDNLYQYTHENIAPNDDPTQNPPQIPPKNTPNKAIEDKYEKYLDDLYYDEKPPVSSPIDSKKESSLAEQLAIDEAEHGSLTKDPYIPDVPEELSQENKHRVVPILSNLQKNNIHEEGSKVENQTFEDKNDSYSPHSLHKRIHYKKEEKTPFSQLEIVLTIFLVILIILVVAYIVFLLALQSNYVNFFDAIGALFTNPEEVINNLFN